MTVQDRCAYAIRDILRVVAMAVAAGAILTPSMASAASDRVSKLEERIRELENEVKRLKNARSSADTGDQTKDATAETAATDLRETVTTTKERVRTLETAVDRIDRQVGSRAVVNAFDAVSLDVGGFIDMAAKHVNGEDNNLTSFNRQVAELLFKAELSPNWNLFWAQSFLRKQEPNFNNPANPTIGNLNNVATDTVLAWGNYRYDDSLQFQMGRFITPHGIVNIQHFPATLLDPDQPQFLRPFSGQTIFPNFTDGFQL